MSAIWRCRLAKLGRVRYISHLDLMRTIGRAFRRAGFDFSQSGGYHPHPLLSFGPALAVGVESQAEYFDAVLLRDYGTADVAAEVNAVLPEGIVILCAINIAAVNASLSSLIGAASYRVWIDCQGPAWNEIAAFTERKSLFVERTGADGISRVLDLRPLLLDVANACPAGGHLDLLGRIGQSGNLRPDELVRLASGVSVRRLLRTGLFYHQGGILLEPISGEVVNWKEIRPILE